MITRLLPLAATVSLLAAALGAQPVVHHDLHVVLHPKTHRIEVTDTLTLPESITGDVVRFSLHGDLDVKSLDPSVRIEEVASRQTGSVPVRIYALTGIGDRKAKLSFAGVINHPLVRGMESARSFSRSAGLITEEGVVLSGGTRWLPDFGEPLVTFKMTVSLPTGWDAVSQGERTVLDLADGRRRVIWDCKAPMDEVYLIAARFHEYSRVAGTVKAYAFLRTPDPELATKYLETTAQYVDMYSRLIGPYPYEKFALVENFWETGYGMPSFTLLGEKIIRFPFILHSSYPHEILHNWWGNSVFVDYAGGNWCEGLTAYLADHLVKEGRGQGVEYRRDTLKKYRNFVRDTRDFPLTKFRSRHSGATQAVGYGKSLMLFHMLRREVGDQAFRLGLARFYRQYKFKRASFGDIAKVFSRAAERDLKPFFDQWVKRAGAPELKLGDVRVLPADGGYRASVTVQQVQGGEPYRLTVSVGFTLEGEDKVVVRNLELNGREGVLDVELEARPLLVQVDPQFDLFRRLDRREIPSSIGQLFGADRLTLIVPDGDDALTTGFATAARTWARGMSGRADIVREGDIQRLPADSAVWVLGSKNRWRTAIVERTRAFGGDGIPSKDHCFALTAVHPADPELAIGWIGADRADALPGLARKLPHYGKYSYVAFAGAEPTNDAKGAWPAVGSPLTWRAETDRSPSAAYPTRSPLARLESVFDPDRLMQHVRHLSSDAFEGRGVGTAGLDNAADYIATQFEKAGLEPGGDAGGWFQTWTEKDGPDGKPATLRNVIGVLRGRRAGWDTQSVVLGAHYDHLGYGWPDVRAGAKGKIHPGADDNASGVSVLIEVAALLAKQLKPGRTLVFVAFSGEEWGLRGSRHYVDAMKRWPARDALAMVNLDTVGRLGSRKLTVFGTGSADEWIHVAMGIGFTTGVQSQSVADDFGSSDQKSFLDAGVPAVQLFAGAHEDYHRPSDTADKVDAAGLMKVATFLRECAVYLSGRDRPFTSKLTKGPRPAAPPAARKGRRVSLGTMPDFAFRGPGVRVGRVMPDSAAAVAGLQKGDIILTIDGKEVTDLRAYSTLLKAYQPGSTVRIEVRRDERRLKVEATLRAR